MISASSVFLNRRHVKEKIRMFAESRPQRTLGSNSQREEGSARIRKSKEKGNPRNLCTTPRILIIFTILTPMTGTRSRGRSLDI